MGIDEGQSELAERRQTADEHRQGGGAQAEQHKERGGRHHGAEDRIAHGPISPGQQTGRSIREERSRCRCLLHRVGLAW
jgi:hypothetical protein